MRSIRSSLPIFNREGDGSHAGTGNDGESKYIDEWVTNAMPLSLWLSKTDMQLWCRRQRTDDQRHYTVQYRYSYSARRLTTTAFAVAVM